MIITSTEFDQRRCHGYVWIHNHQVGTSLEEIDIIQVVGIVEEICIPKSIAWCVDVRQADILYSVVVRARSFGLPPVLGRTQFDICRTALSGSNYSRVKLVR